MISFSTQPASVSLLIDFRILSRPSVPTQAHNPEERLAEYASAHLRHSLAAVDEYHGHFLDFETYLVSGVFHFNLEAVTLETDFVKLYRLKHFTAVALESGRCVMHLETCNEPDVLRRKVAHQHSAYGPVDHVDSADVTRTDGNIIPFVMTCCVKARQVVGVMAEVGVHLEHIVIAMGQRPLESCDVCRAQSLLAATLDDEQTVAEPAVNQAIPAVPSGEPSSITRI